MSTLLRRALYPAMSGARLFSRRLGAGTCGVLTYHGVLPAGQAANVGPADGPLISVEDFRRQLRFLKSRYTPIAPEEFRQWWLGQRELPSRAVLLTCDDGLLNVLTDMLPVLLEEEVRCLFFVTGASAGEGTSYLWYDELYQMMADAPDEAAFTVRGDIVRKSTLGSGGLNSYWWSLVEELSGLNPEARLQALQSIRAELRLPAQWQLAALEETLNQHLYSTNNLAGNGFYADKSVRATRRYRLLRAGEVRQLVEHGMTVGAHTMSHPLLSKAPAPVAEREIRECRAQLEACVQQEVWALAYPFGNEGSAGAREMKMAEDAGYTCAFMNYGGGRTTRAASRFALPRAHVTADMSLAELEAHLCGFHEGLQTQVRGCQPNARGEVTCG